MSSSALLEIYIQLTKFFFFFNQDSPPCKAEQPLRGMELQEKKAQKRLQDTEICLERTYS